MASQYVKNLFAEYKRAVAKNPQLVTQLESVFRVSSYLVAGRFHDSQVLSELFYTASNLIVMLNDAILRKKAVIDGAIPKTTASQKQLMRIITVLEYVEVFIEMTALRLWGQTGRWIAITAIQIAKAVARYLLLVYFKAGIQPVPPICPLNRRLLTDDKGDEQQQSQQQEDVEESGTDMPNGIHVPITVTLKRSGKVMRTLAMAPPQLSHRDWHLPGMRTEGKKAARENLFPSPLNSQRLWGETLHIARPIVHLSSLYLFGLSSWKPWLLSGGLDVTSLCLLGDPKDLNLNEQGEMRRRCMMLLLYLLRSPFYDRYSQGKIVMLLKMMADNVPGMSLLMRPLLDYIPEWQKVYFYIWST
ncbi:peroxisomal membrane protein PEX16-like [Babylonia areolata]|uniref:peroxisomal membrane protein PEX16-like n=1 Tax=Babylonia areolata TaxID=304850 RepID=UPI003FD3154A